MGGIGVGDQGLMRQDCRDRTDKLRLPLPKWIYLGLLTSPNHRPRRHPPTPASLRSAAVPSPRFAGGQKLRASFVRWRKIKRHSGIGHEPI